MAKESLFYHLRRLRMQSKACHREIHPFHRRREIYFDMPWTSLDSAHGREPAANPELAGSPEPAESPEPVEWVEWIEQLPRLRQK
jgi:hypothetical protein